MARRRKPYRRCTYPDCGAVYATDLDFVAAYNAAVDEMNQHGWDPPAAYLDPADVEERATFCQSCARDFRPAA